MRTGTTVGLLLALGAGLVACGDDDGAPTDAGPPEDAGPSDAGEGVDAWMRGDAGLTAPWTVTVRNLISGDRVALAMVCVVDVPQLPCATTDAEGRAILEVPVNLEVQLRATALRHVTTLTTYVSDEAPRSVGIDMPPSSALPLLGGRVDETKGLVAFVVQYEGGDGTPGVAATLSPASGTGPRYTADGLPDDALTETSDDGLGLFVDVDPGRVDVTLVGALCEPDEAWPSASGTLATRVEASALTVVLGRCATPVMDAGVADDAGAADDAGVVMDGGV